MKGFMLTQLMGSEAKMTHEHINVPVLKFFTVKYILDESFAGVAGDCDICQSEKPPHKYMK